MASKSLELPGFYYDRETKKYYKINPSTSAGSGNQLTQKDVNLKNARKSASLHDCKLRGNMVSQIIGHEIGLKPRNSGGLGLQEFYSRIGIDKLKQKSSTKLEISDMTGETMCDMTCEYFFGSPRDDSLYGVWNGPHGTSVAKIKIREVLEPGFTGLMKKRPCVLNCYSPGIKVMDMDVYSTSEFVVNLCLTNHGQPTSEPNVISQSNSSLSLQWLARGPGEESTLTDYSPFRMNFEFPGTYFSCAAGPNRFAVGGYKHIKVFTSSSRGRNTLYDGFMNYQSFEASGNVECLKFTNDNLLLAGTNQGRVVLFDQRSETQIGSSRLAKHSIDHMSFLSNQYHVVISGRGNTLMLIDSRKLIEPVLKYENHFNNSQRKPVCFDEMSNILCCSGDDFVTRFWSLSSGKLLKSLPLPENMDIKAPSGKLPSSFHSYISWDWKCQKKKNSEGERVPILFTAVNDHLLTYGNN